MVNLKSCFLKVKIRIQQQQSKYKKIKEVILLKIRELLMKMVTAVIKPFRLDDVRDALSELGVKGMTVTEVKGFGRQKGHTELYRGAEYAVDFLPKIKLEGAVDENLLEQVVEMVVTAARTEKIGDGKIFVTDIEEVVRIRTGQTGAEAL